MKHLTLFLSSIALASFDVILLKFTTSTIEGCIVACLLLSSMVVALTAVGPLAPRD